MSERYHELAAALQRAVGVDSLPSSVRARHLHAIRARAAALPHDSGVLSGLRRKVAVALTSGSLALTIGSGVTVAAASGAAPGDELYGLKRAVEQVQLQLPADDETRVQRHLALAARRLAELPAAQGHPAQVSELVSAHHSQLAAAARRAGDDAQLSQVVAAATARAQDRLAWLLEEGLPEDASDRARAALEGALHRLAEHAAVPAQGASGDGPAGPDAPAAAPAQGPSAAGPAAPADPGAAPAAPPATPPEWRPVPAGDYPGAGARRARPPAAQPGPKPSAQNSSTAQPGDGFPPPSPGAGPHSDQGAERGSN